MGCSVCVCVCDAPVSSAGSCVCVVVLFSTSVMKAVTSVRHATARCATVGSASSSVSSAHTREVAGIWVCATC
eukprot:2077388-Amphidinium_carterae.1